MRSLRSRNIESSSDENVEKEKKTRNRNRKSLSKPGNGNESHTMDETKVFGSKRKGRKAVKEEMDLDEESLPETFLTSSDTDQEPVSSVRKKRKKSTRKMMKSEDASMTEISSPESNFKESLRKLDQKFLVENYVVKSEGSDTDQEPVNEVKILRNSVEIRKSIRKLKPISSDISVTDVSSLDIRKFGTRNVLTSERKSTPRIKSEEIESIVIDDSLNDANATYDIIDTSEVKDESTLINRSGEWSVEKIDVPPPSFNNRIHLHSEKKNTPRKRWVKFDTTIDLESSLLKNSFTSSKTPNSTAKQSTGKKSSVKSVPNFKTIHQRAYDKLENLKEYSERKKERADSLLSGKNPTKKTISKDLFSNIKAQINEIFKESPEPKELNGGDVYDGTSVFKTSRKPTGSNLKTPLKINTKFAGHTPKVVTDKTKNLRDSTKTAKFLKDKIDKALRVSNSIPKSTNKKVSFGNKTNDVKKTPPFKPLQKTTHIPVKINLDKKENIPKAKPTNVVKPILFNVNLQNKPIFSKGANAKQTENENRPISIFTKGHVAAVANKTKGQDKLANRSNRRDQIKGVRTNRRFELLMQMRNN